MNHETGPTSVGGGAGEVVQSCFRISPTLYESTPTVSISEGAVEDSIRDRVGRREVAEARQNIDDHRILRGLDE